MERAKMDAAQIEAFLREVFPQAFNDGDITIEAADGNTDPIAHVTSTYSIPNP